MHRVFYNNRCVTLGESFADAFRSQNGLFYKVGGKEELGRIVENFFDWEHISLFHLFDSGAGDLWELFTGCFTCIPAGGGVVFNREREFLLIMRNGKWDLPKGKNEPGEDFETAAGRELEEETGLAGLILKKQLISTYHTYHLKDKRILKQTKWFEFLYNGTAGPVLEKREGITGYRWVKPGKARFMMDKTYQSILEVLGYMELL